MRSDRLMLGLWMTLAFAAFFAQMFIDFSVENLGTASIVLCSSLVLQLYILWTPALRSHPLSTFALFGFNLTTQLGALLAQSAVGTALIFGLRQPIQTFGVLALMQAVALMAHAFYRMFAQPRTNDVYVLRGLLERAGLYAAPAVLELWLIGVFGFLNLLAGQAGGGIISKVAQGFQFLAWAPFLIPMFRHQQGAGYCNARRQYFLLGAYVALVALIAIGLGARGLMLSGLMTVLMFGLLTAMRSDTVVSFRTMLRIVAAMLVMGAISVPVSDLVTAMAIAREDRGKVPAMKLVEKTFDNLTDREAITRYRMLGSREQMQSRYDENYIANPLLARFVETKFHDNALYFGGSLLPSERAELADISVDYLWATLPDPMLKALEVDVQKTSLGYSMGDYIAHLSIGTSLGGFRTGSVFAQGFALFGPFFVAIYFAACFVIFWSLDLFAYYRAEGGRVLISTLGMLGLWRLFQYGITGESLHQVFMTVVRGVPQSILLYLGALQGARFTAYILRSMLEPRLATTLTDR